MKLKSKARGRYHICAVTESTVSVQFPLKAEAPQLLGALSALSESYGGKSEGAAKDEAQGFIAYNFTFAAGGGDEFVAAVKKRYPEAKLIFDKPEQGKL